MSLAPWGGSTEMPSRSTGLPLTGRAITVLTGIWVLALTSAVWRPFEQTHESLPGFFFALAVTVSVIAAMAARGRREAESRIDGLIDLLATQETKSALRVDESARIWYTAGMMDAAAGRGKLDEWAEQQVREMRTSDGSSASR